MYYLKNGGDQTIVKQTDPASIHENDVISFYSSDPALSGAVNTHRVVSIETDGNNYRYITKGDANNVVDRYDVDSRDLLGRVVWSSLILGKIVRLVSNPLIFVPIILVPLAIILIANLVKTVSYARKIAKDEEEAAVKEAIQYIRENNLRETGDTTEDSESSERKSE
ncbi:signal peptidase I [Coprococcus aceti]|uniref:signal peptidase I n=1 Tax=Coprococcus aceti TaxID=2981786 RepID=UPI0022E699D5|nr:signal peptidase I [Coprococcus aceti]